MSYIEKSTNGNIDKKRQIAEIKKIAKPYFGFIVAGGLSLIAGATYDDEVNIKALIEKTAAEANQIQPRPAAIELQAARSVIDRYNSEINLLQVQEKFNKIHELTSPEKSQTIYKAKEVTRQEQAYQEEYDKQYKEKVAKRKKYTNRVAATGVVFSLGAYPSAMVIAEIGWRLRKRRSKPPNLKLMHTDKPQV